jgi:type IV secretion system protein VirB8
MQNNIYYKSNINFYKVDYLQLSTIEKKMKLNFGKEKNKDPEMPFVKKDEVVVEISNWYSERYSKVVIQRNIIFLLLLLSIVVVAISVFQVSQVSAKYTLKPFVIQIDEKTGITEIVNPYSDRRLTANQSLNQYFIVKYLMAREGYCANDYNYNYKTIVRLLSNETVYNKFTNFIQNNPLSPLILYGNSTCISVKIRSIEFINNAGKVVSPEDNNSGTGMSLIKFTVVDSNTQEVKSYKIASLGFTYSQMQLNLRDREVNPLGFQVITYGTDNEVLNNQ